MASLLSSTILFSHTTTQLTASSSPNLLTGKSREIRRPWIKAVSSAEQEEENIVQTSPEAKPATTTLPGQRNLNTQYLSVGHVPNYKGLDYIYKDCGEVLDIRIFETEEYALIAWVGTPMAPAWLSTDMLIQADSLNYERT